jgi:hypothetical protein
MKTKTFVTVLLIAILLASCTPNVTSAPTKTAVSIATFTPSPTLIPTQTPTKTPSPTFTSQPSSTSTPKPKATSTPLPTKEVLLQFGIFGGDGGQRTDYYFGRDTPKLILYTDGQLLIQKEDDNGKWFMETTLSVSQMCSFLSQVEKAGFYSLEFNNSSEPAYPTDNPIYKFNDTAQFSEGGSYYVIQVNGPKPRQIYVYSHYVQYLIPEARRVFNLFNNYSPPSKLTDYQAQYMLLWIEKGPGDSIYSTPAPIQQTWYADLPSIDELENDNIEALAYPDDHTNQISQVLVEGEYIKPIFEVFGNRLAYKLFQTENSEYYVIPRPLLPHEPLYDISPFPQASKEFDLPFKCTK